MKFVPELIDVAACFHHTSKSIAALCLVSCENKNSEIYAGCIVCSTKLSSYSNFKQVELLLIEIGKIVHSHKHSLYQSA